MLDMRSYAILALAGANLVAGLPGMLPRDIVRPSQDANTPDAVTMKPYPALPADACGSVDWWWSTIQPKENQYREANSFFWLFTTGTCQSIDQTAPGASSVNRVFVDPQAATHCSKCNFFL
jgi:hypothetical protein